MGFIWRLFAPKSLKRARRSVRRVSHPVRTLTPKPIKQVKYGASRVVHPGEAFEHGVENQIVRAVRGSGHGSVSSPRVAANGATSAQVRAWARLAGYPVADKGKVPDYIVAAYNRAH